MTYRRKKLQEQDELELMKLAFNMGLAFVAGMLKAAEHKQQIVKALQEPQEKQKDDPNPTSQTHL